MNISTIAEMIRQDPTIPGDIPGFLDRMNLQNRPYDQVTETTTVVSQRLRSIAEENGGPATDVDVKAAVAALDSEVATAKALSQTDRILTAYLRAKFTDDLPTLAALDKLLADTEIVLTDIGAEAAVADGGAIP